MVDANQVWSVPEAIDWMRRLSRGRPDVDRGAHQPRRHPGPRGDRRAIAPIKVATGEHVHNRVMWKQLFQAQAAQLRPDRCLSPRERQRGAGRAAAGGTLRHPGLPACRRGRPVRAGGPPRGHRLRLRRGLHGRTGGRVGRPSPRAFPGARPGLPGALCDASVARLRGAAAGVDGAAAQLGLSNSSIESVLDDAEVAVIVTAHPGVDHQAIAARVPLVVDFRGVTRALRELFGRPAVAGPAGTTSGAPPRCSWYLRPLVR